MRNLTVSLRAMLILALVAAGLSISTLVTAQDPDPEDRIEDLALAVHVQNIRASNYTTWLGGNMGDAMMAPVQSVVGDTLDGWLLSGFAGDDDITLDDIKRPTLLNFWASWCGPCRIEFPHLVDVALADDDAYPFDVVFVNMSDSETDALSFLEDYPDDILTVLDKQNRLSNRASINAIPTTLLIDTDGSVIAAHTGTLTPTVSEFLALVVANPGVGTFDATEYAAIEPQATLLPVTVDDAAPIAPGDTVTGTITADDFQDAYVFTGAAGDEVLINLAATADSEVDTYLVLMAADGEHLAENDDTWGTDSEIGYTLAEDGEYLIVATRFLEADGFGEGEYELVLTLEPVQSLEASEPEAEDTDAVAPPQQPGEPFTGVLGGDTMEMSHPFAGDAEEQVIVSATWEPAFIPFDLELVDSEGERLAAEVRAVGGEVTLLPVMLDAAGEYAVIVRRTDASRTISLEYSIDIAYGPAAPAVTAAGSEVDFAYGEWVSGTLNDEQYEQAWTFAGTAGDVVTLEMERLVDEMGGLDGYLILRGPDGSTLVELDDSGGVMPTITEYVLPQTGVYTVVATRFGFANGFSAGDYTVQLTRVGEDVTPSVAATESDADGAMRWVDPAEAPGGLRWITYNDPIEGSISQDDFEDWYILRGRAGDVISVRMAATSDDLDTFLILTDADGFELARSDDTADSTDAAFEFTLPDDSTYLIRATRYGFGKGLTAGEYRLVIESDAEPLDIAEASDSGPLVVGQPVTGSLDFDTAGTRYTFTGSAGDQVTISAQTTSGDLNVALSLRGPDGDEIAANREWLAPHEARIQRFTLPADGDYTVTVLLEDLATAGDYRLLLLNVPTTGPGDTAFEPTGGLDVEVVVIWQGESDLNLTVTGPAQGSGAIMTETDRDFCADGDTPPVERAIWGGDTAASGLYAVTVRYEFNCAGSDAPVGFLLALAVDGELVDLIPGALAREGDEYTTLFEVAAP